MHIGGRPIAELHDYFEMTAQTAARYAISNYSSDVYADRVTSAIRIGMAVEVLALAVIAKSSPVLIADPTDIPSQMLLAGVLKGPALQAGKLRTVNAMAAMDRVRFLHPTFALPRDAFRAMLEVRNAAVHTGLVDRPALQSAAFTMVNVIEMLLTLIDRPTRRFWGHNQVGLVDVMLDMRRDEVSKRVASKLVKARQDFSLLKLHFASSFSAILLEREGRSPKFRGQAAERRPCPACKMSGWLLYTELELYAEQLGGDDSGEVLQYRAGYPDMFDCPVCDLLLRDDELEAVEGFSDQISLPERILTLDQYSSEFAKNAPGSDAEATA